MQTSNYLQDLPGFEGGISYLFQHLDYKTITKCRLLCQKFKEWADDPTFYPPYQYAIKRAFEVYVKALFEYERAIEESADSGVLEQLQKTRDAELGKFALLQPAKACEETQFLLNREKVIELFGGRVAFTKLPKIPMPEGGFCNLSNLEHLPGPIVRGSLKGGRIFVVIRLKDRQTGKFDCDKLYELSMLGICTMGTAGYEPKLLPYSEECEYQIAGGIHPGNIKRSTQRYQLLAEILKHRGNGQYSIE